MGKLLQGPCVEPDGVSCLVPCSCEVHLLELGEPAETDGQREVELQECFLGRLLQDFLFVFMGSRGRQCLTAGFVLLPTAGDI